MRKPFLYNENKKARPDRCRGVRGCVGVIQSGCRDGTPSIKMMRHWEAQLSRSPWIDGGILHQSLKGSNPHGPCSYGQQ